MIAAFVFVLSIAQVDTKEYAELLAKHVKNGRVDYKAIDKTKLDRFVASIGKATVPSDRKAAINFYVDAYNAIVLKSVIDKGRPRSVLDKKDFFSEEVWTVAGKKLSLDALEKQVLNPFAKDPRTHMVLVCAAVGCPILEDKPYTGSDPDARMDAATRRYLAGPTGAIVEPGSIKLSKIFDWYQADFGGEAGVLAFVQKHLSPEANAKAGASPKISYIDYNWTLNQQ